MVKVEQQVKKRIKPTTRMLKLFMVIAAVMFLLLGIVFSTGYMLFCFIFAGLYFWFDANAVVEYEYVYCDGVLSISIIKARRKRYTAHELDISKLEIVAPHDHEAVSSYRNGGSENIPKFDYTSYDDSIKYYTMIIFDGMDKIKLLLDLNEEMLTEIKKKYPTKVII